MSKLYIFIIFLYLNFDLNQCLVKVELHRAELKNKPTSFISVETGLGNLIGYKQEVQNKTINAFYGIPFAEAPVGHLRFKRSRMIKKFQNGTLAALDFKPHCAMRINRLIYHPDDRFEEDCLYAVIIYSIHNKR